MICVNRKCQKELPQDALYCPWCGRKQIKEKLRGKRPNGTGTVYRLSDGKRTRPWVAAKNKIIIGYYATQREAVTALDKLVDVPVTSRYNWTFGQVYNAWFEEYKRNAAEYTASKIPARYNYCPDLHGKVFRSIRTADLQRALDKAAETRKRGTVTHLVSLWSMMYTWAIREGIAERNYAEYVALPPQDAVHHQPFTAAEIEAISKDNTEAAKIILMLIYTGMRVGELFSLKREDYHGNYCIGGLKTTAGKNRIIPVPDIAKPYFDYFADKGADMLVTMNRNTFQNYAYGKVMERCGIQGKSSHSCRATFATNATRSMRQEDLQKVLGHVKFDTTSEYYIHQNAEELINAVNKVW